MNYFKKTQNKKSSHPFDSLTLTLPGATNVAYPRIILVQYNTNTLHKPTYFRLDTDTDTNRGARE